MMNVINSMFLVWLPLTTGVPTSDAMTASARKCNECRGIWNRQEVGKETMIMCV